MTDPSTEAPPALVKGGQGPGGITPRTMAPANVWEPVKCKAHTKRGKPCKRWAIVGGFVCMTHGGSAPQVRRVANERILAVAPRAVQVMVGLMESAESEPVRLKAATELLDRGIGKAVDVTLDITPQDVSGGPSPLDLAIARALTARGLGEGGQADDDIVDAELVDPSDQGEGTSDQAPPHT